MRADVKSIQDLYGTRGYIDFQAGANTTPGPGNTIDVTFNMDEGVQSYVEHINISGNTRTKDKVIRREIAADAGRRLQHRAGGCEQAAADEPELLLEGGDLSGGHAGAGPQGS